LAGAGLNTLVAAIKSSPIVVRLAARLWQAAHVPEKACHALAAGWVPVFRQERAQSKEVWARIRRSPDVDAFVLAWIASHARGARRAPRTFM
jgi:hypothetical protein